MTAVPTSAEIHYQGPGLGSETWGFTQANFQISIPGRSAKESAILLNDPAARLLAQELSLEDSPEARDLLARAVGEAWLPTIAGSGSVDSLITISVAFLNNHPEVVEAIKKAMP
jgi:hypothetical protein